MAFIDAAPGAGRRRFDRELPLVPFIDFLSCLIAFMLVCAAWTEHARLTAGARVSGPPAPPPVALRQTLHVTIQDSAFEPSWRRGDTVVHTLRVPRAPVRNSDGTTRYPELARIVAEEWSKRGVHRSAHDPAQDTAVLHSPNSVVHGELVAVIDALHAPTRAFGGAPVPAFTVSFAAN